MGVCSSKNEDVFTKRTNDISTHSKEAVVMSSCSEHLDNSNRDLDKMRVVKSSKILIIGDNRIKVATACYISAYVASHRQDVEVIVGTRNPEAAKNSLLIRAGVRLIKADMNSPGSLLPAIRESGADTVFLVSPNQKDRSIQTNSGISACRRAGVGHVVVLSSTCVERREGSIFGDQCKQIESFIKTTRMSYTVVRIPILIDNYLSQLQSMSEYGIFYRPLPPNARRNSIAVSDVGAAVGMILLTPGNYADKTISLNGPFTDCETAAAAFTAALNKPVIYEQVSYESYQETLLEAAMPEWQVNGILELFKMFERREPFCQGSMKELETILGRRPTTVFDLALSAIAKTRPRGASDPMQNDKSDHGLAAAVASAIGQSTAPAVQSTSSADSMESPSDQKENGTSDPTVPYSNLKINRSIDSAPSSSLSPAGIAGVLKITLCMNGLNPNTAARTDPNTGLASTGPKAIDSVTLNGGDLNRNLDRRYCILLDGIFTFLPSSISQSPVASNDANGKKITSDLVGKKTSGDPGTKTRAVGSMENRSIPLSGYVIRKIDDKKISLKGSKGESTSYLLEATTPEDCRRWLNVISAHVEHVDSKAGSKWIF